MSEISYSSDDESVGPSGRSVALARAAGTAATTTTTTTATKRKVSRKSVSLPAPAKMVHRMGLDVDSMDSVVSRSSNHNKLSELLADSSNARPPHETNDSTNDDSRTNPAAAAASDDSSSTVASSGGRSKRAPSPKAGVGRTTATKAVKSPYEVGYCAEDEELLFVELQERLEDRLCHSRKLYRLIASSKLTYSDSWLSEGWVHETNVGIPPPSTLVVCLNNSTFGKADLAVLKKMAKELGLPGMVQKLVAAMGVATKRKYPKIASRTSTLLAPKKEVLKSLLFLSRVYCAKEFLNKSFEDAGGDLEQKMRRCLDIIEENASVAVTKKKRGRKKKRDSDTAATEDGGPLQRETENHNSQSDSHDDDEEWEATPAKRRRVSVALERPSGTNDTTAEEDGSTILTTSAMMARFDQLEEYFRNGLQAVQQLRQDVQRKDTMYKKALNDKIWGKSHQPSRQENLGDEQPLLDDGDETEFARNGSGVRKWQGVIDEEEDDGVDTAEDEPETPTPIKPGRRASTSTATKTAKPVPPFQEEEEEEPKAETVEKQAIDDTDGGENGLLMVDKAVAKRIREVVRGRVWRKIKMIKNQDHLQNIAQYVVILLFASVDALDIPLKTWARIYGPTIKYAFATHRGTVRNAMKRAVHEYMDDNNDTLVSVEDLNKLRNSQTKAELAAFQWFWDSLLECVSQKSCWPTHKHKAIISAKVMVGGNEEDVVSRSDEAYCLLMFENSRDKWMTGWNNRQNGASVVCHTLWTAAGKKPDEYSLLNDAGNERWKDLLKHVKNDRASDRGNEAEKRMLARITAQHGL